MSAEEIVLHGVVLPVEPAAMRGGLLARMRAGTYEAAEVAALAGLLRRGDRVLDIGAGFGVTGTFAALRPGVERVVSVEANPRILDHLRRVHARNGVRVDLRQGVLAPGGGRGTRRFHVRPRVWGSSLFAGTGIPGDEVAVPVLDLEAVMAELRPTVICCDIEGGEHELLMAADLSGVRALVVELHPAVIGRERTQELRRRLAGLGFRRRRGLSTRGVLALERPRRWTFGRIAALLGRLDGARSGPGRRVR